MWTDRHESLAVMRALGVLFLLAATMMLDLLPQDFLPLCWGRQMHACQKYNAIGSLLYM